MKLKTFTVCAYENYQYVPQFTNCSENPQTCLLEVLENNPKLRNMLIRCELQNAGIDSIEMADYDGRSEQEKAEWRCENAKAKMINCFDIFTNEPSKANKLELNYAIAEYKTAFDCAYLDDISLDFEDTVIEF